MWWIVFLLEGRSAPTYENGMPIHLPPRSRREFLKRALLAGAGLVFTPGLFAASAHINRHTWAFFSDTHVSGDTAKVARGVNMAAHLRAATKEVLALPERPAALFLTGDCAFNSGEEDDYFQLLALLDPLRSAGLPLHIGLGNHDHRENFWAGLPPEDAKTRTVANRQVALIKSAHVNWFLLDSLEVTLQTPGSLGPKQLRWLAQTLDANRRKPAVVLVHHHPGDGKAGTGALKDTAALLEIIHPRRQVKAWVFGHTHQWRTVTEPGGLHLINLPPVAYTFQPDEPAGWVHATTHRDGIRLELRCVDPKRKHHGQVVDLKWRTA